MKRKKNMQLLFLKAARKKSREDEIAQFGHPINYRNVVVNTKKYNRKRDKANRNKSGSLYFLWKENSKFLSRSFFLLLLWRKINSF
ncbi:MAG: hypothetical protein PHH23_05375 [Paludibacteraceae bacterium]|nr:hypothetical protein [Paludibacteraceae bacterium]